MVHLAAFAISFFLVAQPADSADDNFKTNSGEEFVDPFADPREAPGAIKESPQVQDVAPSQPIQEGPPPTVQPRESLPREDLQIQPSLEPQQPASAPNLRPAIPIEDSPALENPSDNFDFPQDMSPEGPVSQDFQGREINETIQAVGGWNFEFGAGGGFNFNRRPHQVHLEVEGGYRIWKSLDLNGILYYRFLDERNLGFLVHPTWTWRLTGRDTSRIDFRAGLGTGWILTGVRGNDFQLGFFPVRTSAAVIFYAIKAFSIVLSADIETYLFSIDSDGNKDGFIADSKGPPAQFISTIGLRWEY